MRKLQKPHSLSQFHEIPGKQLLFGWLQGSTDQEKFKKSRTHSDQDRENFINLGPNRTRTGEILENPDQLGPGQNKLTIGPTQTGINRFKSSWISGLIQGQKWDGSNKNPPIKNHENGMIWENVWKNVQSGFQKIKNFEKNSRYV